MQKMLATFTDCRLNFPLNPDFVKSGIKKPFGVIQMVFFILFISLISMPSKLNTAIDEIQVSANMNEVKSIFA